MTDSNANDRIAKVMARAGVASRRDAERMILEGRVAVNGKKIASPALDVAPGDRITLDGRAIDEKQPTRLWLYYKPLGLVVSEKDEKGRQTIFDTMPEGMPRVMSVGRLDLNSEGLLLLTNDGELKRRLELPETGWLRKYRVRVNGQPNDLTFDPLRRGITIEGEDFQPMEVVLDRQQGANAWLTVGIREGRNREIRRAMAAVGLTVNRLIRVSYGPFRLNEMKAGDITEVKAKVMRDQLGALLPGNEDHVERPSRISREGGGPRNYDQRNRAEPAESYRNRDRSGERGFERGPRPDGDRPFSKGPRPDGDRPFSRGPRPDGDRPFSKGPRADGDRPYSKGPRADGDRPFNKGPRADGDRPYSKGPRADGDRPFNKGPRPTGDRPFSKGPRAEGDRPFGKGPLPTGDRPFSKSPRPEGDRPFSRGPRPEGDRPFNRAPRPEAGADEGARKPRHKGPRPPREEGATGERPRREGFASAPRGEGFKGKPRSADGPRSSGFKSHGGPAGKSRAEGFKSHADGPRGERPARSFGDRPQGGGFGKPRPAGSGEGPARSYGKPPGERPVGKSFGKPAGRPAGGPGGKTAGGPGGKPFGKPRGDRPQGGPPGRGPRSPR
ncbi:pseudouridine synthase [Frigidibacter sp. MR17.14]|uniref:pseudouridine synthase n=1 Tax=Frigidibacter sp. MR17.14 TaxID=3126509 RepID=UPI003012D382